MSRPPFLFPFPLRIRQWTFAMILLFVALNALFYHFSGALSEAVLRARPDWQPDRQAATLDTALRAATAAPDRWRDPAWQATFRDTLAPLGVSGRLLDPAGAEIVSVGSVGAWSGTSREVMVFDGARPVGTVALATPWRPFFPGPFGALLALCITLTVFTIQTGRYVVRPLEALSRAARQIAAGDLDVALPVSDVREVLDACAAFEAMGAGLRASIAQQAALEEERRFFVGAIAHDLRTPLFALRGHLDGLARGLAGAPAKRDHYLAVCRQKADQLDRLVADLFTYTKAEYLDQPTCRETVALGALLGRAAEGLRPRAQARGIAVVLDDPGAPLTLAADAHLLERAVENLLDNALRYTPADGTITVGWHATPGGATFTVTDTGPGIAPRDLPHLFDPLYRAEDSRNPATGGVGLGLAIARRILRAHNGDLTAANTPAGGALFVGTLPGRQRPG